MSEFDPDPGFLYVITRPTYRRIPSFVALRRHWRDDYNANGGRFSSPGFQAMAVYRLGVWAETVPSRWRRYPLWKLYRFLFTLVSGVYGIEIPVRARIGRRLQVAYQSGIIISPLCRIGDDCLIHQNVTIGLSRDGVPLEEAVQIGDRVQIGAGAVVLNPARIGDDCRIGPNTVVRHEVPAFSKVLPPDPKILPRSARRRNRDLPVEQIAD